MSSSDRIYELVKIGWDLYTQKVSGELQDPENEKMMQLQLASVFQTLASLYEASEDESIKVLLEVPVKVRPEKKNIIDIVIQFRNSQCEMFFPIELKCFRKMTRDQSSRRGGGNLSMYDYWEDIENIELYSTLESYQPGVHLAITDDDYFVKNQHKGEQVKVYSTSRHRGLVSGELQKEIRTRKGHISLKGQYDMSQWLDIGSFYRIMHQANGV